MSSASSFHPSSALFLLPIRRCAATFLLLLCSIAHLSNVQCNSPFLDIFLRLEPVDDFCGALQCNITYAISVLTNTQNQFDLQSVMLQDGHMTRQSPAEEASDDDENGGSRSSRGQQRRYFFEENTVVRLSEQLRRAHQKIYLGIMLFDVPDDIQDYLVVDVTDVIQLGRRAKTDFSSDTANIGIQVYRRNEAATGTEAGAGSLQPADAATLANSRYHLAPHHSRAGRHHNNNNNALVLLPERTCTCAERNCGCCEHVSVRKIHLDDEVCVNVTYVSEDIGVRLSLSVDNHIYYSKELSLRNPPPACFEVPHLREYASICVRLYNMELREDRLTGCSEIEAILLHLRVARHKIGCFSIPI